MTCVGIGPVELKVIPSAHFVERCAERLGSLSPVTSAGEAIRLTGFLVVEERKRGVFSFYLDVAGLGRFVIAPRGGDLVGVTYLPRIYTHVESGGS